MTPICTLCAHRHTTDLTSPSACGCADHAWTDACPYVGTSCPPAAERDEITGALARSWLDTQTRPLMLSGPRRFPPSMNDLLDVMERISYGPPRRTEPIKLTPDQWALIPHGAPNPYGPLTPAGDLLGVPVFMVTDESESTPVVEGWVKGPIKPTHKLRWWQRLWHWRRS